MPRRYYRSSSFKMALLFTALLSLSGMLLAYFLYDFGQQSFVRETRAAIDNEIEHILLVTEGQDQTTRVNHVAERSARAQHPYYLYHRADGAVLAGNLGAIPDQVERLTEGLISFRLPGGARLAAEVHTFADGDRLLVARDIGQITAAYERLQWIAALIIVFMVTVIIASFLISTYVVARINRMAGTAQQIMATGDLSRRLDIESNWDDLSYLAETLNALLDRILKLMIGIREVTNNIAHDLRTPLTRVRNRLETMQHNGADEATLGTAVEECDQLLGTFNALLRIASLERGSSAQSFTVIDPANVLRDVVELYEPLADERGLILHTEIVGMKQVSGDRELLSQLFANLLDNAIKFSPDHGRLELSLRAAGDQVCLQVADQGPGIPAEERERVFERFYRMERSRHEAGNGLGLSLVQAIVGLHRGRIELQDNTPGLRVMVWLPGCGR